MQRLCCGSSRAAPQCIQTPRPAHKMQTAATPHHRTAPSHRRTVLCVSSCRRAMHITASCRCTAVPCISPRPCISPSTANKYPAKRCSAGGFVIASYRRRTERFFSLIITRPRRACQSAVSRARTDIGYVRAGRLCMCASRPSHTRLFDYLDRCGGQRGLRADYLGYLRDLARQQTVALNYNGGTVVGDEGDAVFKAFCDDKRLDV